MASLAVMTVVSGLVETNWPHTQIHDLNDRAAVPDDGNAFLRVGYPTRDEVQMSFGAPTNCHAENGAFVVVLKIPIGTGVNDPAAPWITRIESLMQAFRGKYTGGVEFLGFVGPTTNDDSDDGAFYEISFSCAYRYLFVA
jgi:hypothetical protein